MTLPESLLQSLRLFAVKTEKNVSEAAHDEYVHLINEMLHKLHLNNSVDQRDDGDPVRQRRGRDLWGHSHPCVPC